MIDPAPDAWMSDQTDFFAVPGSRNAYNEETLRYTMTINANENNAMRVDLEGLSEIHPDECSSSNFLDPDYERRYATVADFMEDFERSAVPLNLCVRWDIERDDDARGYHARVHLLQQRKGIFLPIWIAHVEDTDLPRLHAFLRRHWEYLQEIWNPISGRRSR